MKTFYVFAVLLIAIFSSTTSTPLTEDDLKIFLQNVNEKLYEFYSKEEISKYNYEINDSEENFINAMTSMFDLENYLLEITRNLPKFNDVPINDELLKRQLQKIPKASYLALSKDDYRELMESLSVMNMIFKNVPVCSYRDPDKCDLTLIPGVQDILHTTNDEQEIKYYWLEWRNKTGISVRDHFIKFLELYRKTAKLNGFTKPSDMWFHRFDDENVLDELQGILKKLKPIFHEFHGHVRYLLRQKYGEDTIKPYWPFPQHIAEVLLGDSYRYDDTGKLDFPYPEKHLPNITEILQEKGYDPKKLFNLAVEYFESIGMKMLPEDYWEKNSGASENAINNILTCTNKAWHFYGARWPAVSYCNSARFSDYLAMHEIVPEIMYTRLFLDQPTVFKDEPLPNFFDAISEVFSISASSPKHLEKIGLIPKGTFDKELMVNRLYIKGMQTVFLLPILFLLDKYRVQMVDREVSAWDNCAFWELTVAQTGAVPPVKRTNKDFDAPSKLLIGVDNEYSSTIISYVVRYQILKHFCTITGEYVENDEDHLLSNCDLSDHPEIGDILKKAMSVGASKSWRDVLEMIVGTRELDHSGILEYYSPLRDWLVKHNRNNNAEIGWVQDSQCEP